jgi:hypothetical protein
LQLLSGEMAGAEMKPSVGPVLVCGAIAGLRVSADNSRDRNIGF